MGVLGDRCGEVEEMGCYVGVLCDYGNRLMNIDHKREIFVIFIHIRRSLDLKYGNIH